MDLLTVKQFIKLDDDNIDSSLSFDELYKNNGYPEFVELTKSNVVAIKEIQDKDYYADGVITIYKGDEKWVGLEYYSELEIIVDFYKGAMFELFLQKKKEVMGPDGIIFKNSSADTIDILVDTGYKTYNTYTAPKLELFNKILDACIHYYECKQIAFPGRDFMIDDIRDNRKWIK
jgi:hypothetical protein